MNTKFHISLPCKDVKATKRFYKNILGFEIGRKSLYWFDVNLFGNQITFTLDDKSVLNTKKYSFEEVQLPSFHFGIILDEETWTKLYEKYKDEDFFSIGITKFLSDKKGEHKSFFITDVNGYFIEFKNFSVLDEVFEWE
jgi:extradiol dioxygenase family protein